jgi:hypothetical protein
LNRWMSNRSRKETLQRRFRLPPRASTVIQVGPSKDGLSKMSRFPFSDCREDISRRPPRKWGTNSEDRQAVHFTSSLCNLRCTRVSNLHPVVVVSHTSMYLSCKPFFGLIVQSLVEPSPSTLKSTNRLPYSCPKVVSISVLKCQRFKFV